MPNPTMETTASGVYRRCPGCRDEFPATRGYFYTYPNGRLERCNQNANDCHGRYYRNRAATRSTGRVTAPASRGPKFGVEIEYVGASREAVADALNAAGVNCHVEGYNHNTRRHWKVVTDSSVPGGGELVSPPLSGESGRQQIETVCRALQSIGARADRSTGLHVHHDMSGHTPASFARAFRAWYLNQESISWLVAPSRRRSNWCQPLTAVEVEHIASMAERSGLSRQRTSFRVDRYKSLNVQSFPKYGTVEIRQHQGSTNARKMLSWIEFGQAFFKMARNASVEPVRYENVNDLLDALVQHGGLAESTATYLKARAVALGYGRTHAPEQARTVDPDGETCACGEALNQDGQCPRLTVRAPAYAV